MTYELTTAVNYITAPTLDIEEIQVLTFAGEGKIPGQHKWNPIKISFRDFSAVFEETITNPIFDLTFQTGSIKWKFFGCQLISLDMINRHEFTMSFCDAQQEIVQ